LLLVEEGTTLSIMAATTAIVLLLVPIKSIKVRKDKDTQDRGHIA